LCVSFPVQIIYRIVSESETVQLLDLHKALCSSFTRHPVEPTSVCNYYSE